MNFYPFSSSQTEKKRVSETGKDDLTALLFFPTRRDLTPVSIFSLIDSISDCCCLMVSHSNDGHSVRYYDYYFFFFWNCMFSVVKNDSLFKLSFVYSTFFRQFALTLKMFRKCA